MRKAILIFSAISFVCWSVAVVWAWIRICTGEEPFRGQPGLFIIIGMLLFVIAIVLFLIRCFQQQRVLKRHGMNLTGRNLFRRIAGARPYQREVWLEGVVILSVIVCVLVSDAIQLIVDYKLNAPFDFNKYKSLQNTIGLTFELAWPLSALLYALLSRDLKALVKEKKRGE